MEVATVVVSFLVRFELLASGYSQIDRVMTVSGFYRAPALLLQQGGSAATCLVGGPESDSKELNKHSERYLSHSAVQPSPLAEVR